MFILAFAETFRHCHSPSVNNFCVITFSTSLGCPAAPCPHSFFFLAPEGKEAFACCSSSSAGSASPAAQPGILGHLLELQISTEKDQKTTKPCLACPWCKNKLSVNLLLLHEAVKSQTCPQKQAGRTFPYHFITPCSVIQWRCLMCSKLHLYSLIEEKAKWPDSILLPTLNRKLLLKQPPPCNQGWQNHRHTPSGSITRGEIKLHAGIPVLPCQCSGNRLFSGNKKGCQNALMPARFCMPEAEGSPQTWVSSVLDARKRPSLAQSCSEDALWSNKSFLLQQNCSHYTTNWSMLIKQRLSNPESSPGQNQ